MNSKQAREFVHEIFSDLLNPEYLERIPKIYSKEVVAEMGGEIVYYNDIVNRAEYRLSYFKEIENDILDVLVDEDKIVVRIRQTYVLKGQDKRHSLENFLIYQIDDRKVVRAWGSFTPNFNYKEKV
jgi:hypothetical protein